MTNRAWRLLSACLALASVLPLTGCPADDNWGDAALGFVEGGNFHQISHDYAASQLDKIWLGGLFGAAEDGDARVKQWVMQLPTNPDPAPINVATATYQQQVEAYVAVDNAIADLDTESEDLGDLLQSLDVTSAICSDRKLFDARGLDWVGLYGPLAMIEPRLKPHEETFEFYVSTSFSLGSGGDDNVYTDPNDEKSLWEAAKQVWNAVVNYNGTNQQNDKLSQALDELPSRALQPDAAFLLSQASCARAFNATTLMLQNAVAEAKDLTHVFDSRRTLLVARRDLIGSYLLPEEVKALADTDKGHAILSQTQSTFLKGDLVRELTNRMEEAKRIGMSAVVNPHCSERLRLFEQFYDMMLELDAQFTVLQQLEGSQASTDAAKELASIKTFESEYVSVQKRISSQGCQ